MKRKNIPLCVGAIALSASGSAFPQSSVTVTGLIDAGVTYVNNQHGGSKTFLDSGIFAPNLLTLKGTEDLGGGTHAIFELTSQFDLGNGSINPGAGGIFSRTSYVGLSNDRLGSVTFGNQYDFMYETLTLGFFDGALLAGGIYDFRQGPFAALGVPGNPTGSFDFDRAGGTSRVANSVKYRSPGNSALQFGALYGLGGVPGSFSANSTLSFGMNYTNGPLALGAAYTNVKYTGLFEGGDGSIRNFGFGAHYRFGSVLAMLLYTNTANTASNAKINVYKTGAQWDIGGPWAVGLNYTFMDGNAVLDNNRAHQVSGVVQYHLSKRTFVYVEGIYQHASGDAPVTQAWINALNQPGSASTSGTQVLARIGLSTRF
ncbi:MULTISPECIES: porin [Burkholderia]|uniref:Outer membrane porin n=1 Tax=Burkholderia paludis TaxID=1506587 RepID=A0A6J5F1U0_9BURK|nr:MULTISPECIES: porin [Burkholderia]CAB3771542.1 Outer membrane porin protein 32 [Burkholderia paludis]VWC28420.1 outer membrane porin [Burkholderia paludis]